MWMNYTFEISSGEITGKTQKKSSQAFIGCLRIYHFWRSFVLQSNRMLTHVHMQCRLTFWREIVSLLDFVP